MAAMRRWAAVAGLGSVVAGAVVPAMGAVNLSFTRLVQTGDPIPGTGATYLDLSRATGSQGNFAWYGAGAGVAGIYSRIGGVDGVVAQSGMAIPGGGGTWSTGSFTSALGKIDGTDVAFRAGGGIYASFGGAAPIRIADNSMVNPATGQNFTNLQQPYISGGQIAFTNGVNGPAAGAAVYSGGTLQPVWSTSTALPAPMTGNIALMAQAVMSGGDVAMQVFDGSFKQGILTNRSGSLEVVASGYENVPGQAFTFGQFLDPAIRDDEIAFIAWGPNGSGPGGSGFFKGVYRDTPGGLEVIADTATIAPDVGTTFTDFARGPAIFGDTVLFSASTDSDGGLDGIYVYFNGQLERIIDNTMSLDGKTPVSFDLSSESLYSANEATFLATFSDGTEGIYTVEFNPIPEPGTLVTVLLVGLGLARRRVG